MTPDNGLCAAAALFATNCACFFFAYVCTLTTVSEFPTAFPALLVHLQTLTQQYSFCPTIELLMQVSFNVLRLFLRKK